MLNHSKIGRTIAMAKLIPLPPDRSPDKSTTQAGLVKTFEIELITPMFGGGVEPRVNDPSFPIRATAIRGQLRFWWRATRGRRFTNPNDLWLREEEIFGGTRFQSPLRIQVSIDPRTSPQYAAASKVDRFGPDGYAMFPLQQGDSLLREGLKFRVGLNWLTVTKLNQQRDAVNQQLAKENQPQLPSEVADIADELEVAVWAWVNFGGLGGRTRRGCGSLWCKELAPKSVTEIDEWFRAATQRFTTPTSSTPLWPCLGGQLLYNERARKPVDAWLQVMATFKNFRQGVGIGRYPGRPGNHPGQSFFPEAETIRETIRHQGKRGGTHPPLGDVPKDAFPRAEFGLPIVFQFKNNEVSQTVLYPRVGTEPMERMASPLILKALCLADGTAVAAIIPLDVPWFTEVELTLGGRNKVRQAFPRSAVRRPDLGTYTNPPSPLAGSPAGSAIEAFLAFAQNADNGFIEVSR